jgi:glycosyltransferase involved in cell wall biosynthesis
MTYDPNFQETPPKQIIICIPAYNEEKNIGEIVSKAKTFGSEVIVYDDGSTDRTAEVATSSGAVVLMN